MFCIYGELNAKRRMEQCQVSDGIGGQDIFTRDTSSNDPSIAHGLADMAQKILSRLSTGYKKNDPQCSSVPIVNMG